VKYVQDSCIHQGVFGVGLFNDVSQILPRLTLVAMATNFEPKLALVSDIYPRYLRLSKVFRAELLNDVSQILPQKFEEFGRKFEIMREEYIRLVTI